MYLDKKVIFGAILSKDEIKNIDREFIKDELNNQEL